MAICFCGIDPGSTGAVAVIHESGELEIFDTPLLDQEGRKVIDWRKCGALILRLPTDSLITIERQWARPPVRENATHNHGTVQSFGIGLSFGIWLGVLGALDCRVQQVTPQAWKKAMMPGAPKDKDASRDVADTIWPHQRDNWWARKKDHGRTDALLIAEYGRRIAK